MKKSNMKLGLGIVALSLFILTACSDDSKSSSSSPAAAVAATNVDISGSYSGNYRYVETDKQTNQSTQQDSTGVVLNITGTSPNFVISRDGNSSDMLSVVVSGNTFTGANGSGFFAGSSYSGRLDGSLLSLNETGEDATSSWVGTYTGSKTSGGGSIDFAGTFNGNYNYSETDKVTNQTTTQGPTSMMLSITGTSPTYTVTKDGSNADQLTITAQGNNFIGSNGTGFFSGSTYTGSINGNTINLNETGEDATSTWVGNYVGNR